MDFEKLTDRARGFLQAAQTIAVREHHQRITPAHYLKALLDDEQGIAAGLIQAAGGDPKTAKREVDALVGDPSRIARDLSWVATTTAVELAQLMVDADLRALASD